MRRIRLQFEICVLGSSYQVTKLVDKITRYVKDNNMEVTRLVDERFTDEDKKRKGVL